MDACDLLMEQHRQVESLFHRFRLEGEEDLPSLVGDLADVLTVHTELEERIFYPGVRRRETEEVLIASVEDHRKVQQLLVNLLVGEPDDEAYSRMMDELVRSMRAHIRQEETELFPLVRSLVESDELITMADSMNELAQELRSEDDVAGRRSEESHSAAPL